jgi:hemolysin III
MSQAVDRVRLGPLHNPVRGILHGAAALVALTVAAHFLSAGPPDAGMRRALLAFAVTQVTLFLVSALYHSLPWTPVWKRRMQRADHAMIFLAIAGSVTPVAWVALDGWPRELTVGAAWAIALAGALQKWLLPWVHERASIPFQIAQAVLAVPALVAFAERFPGAPGALALLGAGLYGVGALVFLTERPRLWPRVFSFHELFHLLVVAGSGTYYLLATRWLARIAG